MARPVLHKSWIKRGAFGGTTYTTQCRRASNRAADPINVADDDMGVTCKMCIKIMAEGLVREDYRWLA